MSNQKILELEAALNDQKSLSENTTEMTNLKKSFNRAISIHEEGSTRTKVQINELEKRLENAGKDIFVEFFNIERITYLFRKTIDRKR